MIELLLQHLVTLFLALLFAILLWRQESSKDAELQYFWLTILSCLILVAADVSEETTSKDASLVFLRIFFSVLGYTFRSTAALSLLLVISKRVKRRFLMWIPALITFLVSITAFFSKAAFWYDGTVFHRGPLGYVVFAMPVVYILAILLIAFRDYAENKGQQRYSILACAVFCLAAAAADTVYSGSRLTEAILISSVFLYILLRAHDNRHDPLTNLLNRQAFYDDCTRLNNRITAVASLDMNGLKTINDTHGHGAGDAALVKIAECMNPSGDRKAKYYRIGGDEFVILFFDASEQSLSDMEKQMKESVSNAGYSISIGFVLRDRETDLEEALRESDRRMYEDKANYYRSTEQ